MATASTESKGRAVTRPSRPKRRRTRTRINWRRLGTFLAVVYLIFTFGSLQWRTWQAQRKVSDLELRIRVEQERAAVLESEITYRNSDEYIELVARRELGLVKPGETPVLYGVNR